MPDQPTFEAMVSKRFDALLALDDGERAVLSRLATRPRTSHRADMRFPAGDGESSTTRLVVSGWAAAVYQFRSGGRQIIEILLPGDILGMSIQPRATASAQIIALTPLRTIDLPEAGQTWRNREISPRWSARLEAMLAEQHHFLQNQVMRLGRMSAYDRLANLLCELYWRMSQRGLAEEGRFPMPLTQEQIADTMGLSVVHVNRTLQQLRREGAIRQEHGVTHLLAEEALRDAGSFGPPGRYAR